jgi:hypothetical protein
MRMAFSVSGKKHDAHCHTLQLQKDYTCMHENDHVLLRGISNKKLRRTTNEKRKAFPVVVKNEFSHGGPVLPRLALSG